MRIDVRDVSVSAFGLGLALLCASGRAEPSPTTAGSDLVASATRPFESQLAGMRLRVDTNGVLNARGEAVWLRGVNIASLEWSSRGEHLDEAFREALEEWNAKLIRVPLAQDRWFGKAEYQKDAGAAYRLIVDKLVDTCAQAKAYIDLDLHWSGAGKWSSDGGKLAQHQMPDANSVLFWKDVATRYRNHPNVIFGLYNEPHDVSWEVWRDGGTVIEKPGKSVTTNAATAYEAPGLQKLYDTVRAAGAGNIVTVSGLEWGYDLSGVAQGYAIRGTNIIYESHPYPFKKDWDKKFGNVSQTYPVFLGEWGGGSKDLNYGHSLLAYAQAHHLHWTAWCFHPTCGPPLLKNWDFEPNQFGELVRTALAVP